MYISNRMLRDRMACYNERRLFLQLFGNQRVLITKELCLKHAQKFDWGWAALNLFPDVYWITWVPKSFLILEPWRIADAHEGNPKRRRQLTYNRNKRLARLFGSIAETIN